MFQPGWPAAAPARPAERLDNSAAQLATARQLQDRFGLRFPLMHASAEQAPFADASFDLAISEYGASIWCDPYAWIPEAARLLRPGGQLIFLVNSVLLMLTVPDEDGRPATERGAITRYPFVTLERARQWPCEEVRKAANQLEYYLYERRRGAVLCRRERPVGDETIQNWSICVRSAFGCHSAMPSESAEIISDRVPEAE